MGIIRNAANRKIKGRIGDTTYYVSMDRQIARQALNSSNYGESARRSPSQQGRRVMWSNLVNFYKSSKGWMPKAFESKSSKQTDYNRFMSANLAGARIALTKTQAAVGACVADAFIVAQGSLRSIQVSRMADTWQTDIALGALTINDNTTVGVFADACIKNNNWILEGDQISFISYQQYIDAQNTPHVICTAYEVTLYRNSEDKLRDYLPEFCSQVSTAKNLATSNDISTGGFAYILSRNLGGGRLQVSTQQLITNNDVMILQYSSATNVQAAIESYGVDTDKFLDTGSVPVTKAEQPLYIEFFNVGTRSFAPGAITAGWTLGSLGSADFKIKLSASTTANVTNLVISHRSPDYPGDVYYARTTSEFSSIAADGTMVVSKAWLNSNIDPTSTIAGIEIDLNDGQKLSATFDTFNPSAD